jgi:hypothetical protein
MPINKLNPEHYTRTRLITTNNLLKSQLSLKTKYGNVLTIYLLYI